MPPLNQPLLAQEESTSIAATGPNQRSDYHINETEEWFYQYKGGMLLRVVEDNEFRDVRIEEGEMFLLPANTPHNPVYFANTVGIVLEPVLRPTGTLDRLRWYCRSPIHLEPTIIHEEAFRVIDLGSQLKPVIKRCMEGRDLRKCSECGQYADEQYFASARL